ncbi:MAG TPA: Zn-dependent alcohol dehydrogenase [Thermoanaerobaculia bacterium]|nr:Zn-dependent alcohol dehydrogenase [Thermoanaerobaculia bacterium]
MRAAVCYEFGEPLVLANVVLDAPHAGEVKVRLAATAICHSDVHLINGDWGGERPVVPGHEAAGVIEAVGENVTGIKLGDRVVVSLLRSCGTCFQCAKGNAHMCEGAFALNKESRLRDERGHALQHGIRVGAFAEAVVVDQSQVVAIPDRMPFDRAALLGCGVITGVGAVMNSARVAAGDSVVVIGTGGVGLNAIQAAALAGANPIIAVDRVEKKLEAARVFGATHTINAGAEELRPAVRKLTSKRGVDFAFVAVGSPDAVSQAFTLIRPAGTVVIVGMPEWEATVPLRIADLVWNEQRIIGSRMGATHLRTDVPKLVNLYLEGKLKLDELISRRYPLEQINEAITAMETGEALGNVIVFGERRADSQSAWTH